MPYMHTTKTGKNPGRRFMVYQPKIKGDLPTPELEALYATQAKSYALHAKEQLAFVTAFTAHLTAKGFVGKPFINAAYYDKVSVAMDDGKGVAKVALVEITDWAVASKVLGTNANA